MRTQVTSIQLSGVEPARAPDQCDGGIVGGAQFSLLHTSAPSGAAFKLQNAQLRISTILLKIASQLPQYSCLNSLWRRDKIGRFSILALFQLHDLCIEQSLSLVNISVSLQQRDGYKNALSAPPLAFESFRHPTGSKGEELLSPET